MITYFSTERFSRTITKLIREADGALGRTIRSLSYEELLFERAGPVGHAIFTDFDRLSRYELETVATYVSALRRVAPGARILNDPVRALERTPLLAKLHHEGINAFAVTRVDTGERPRAYPVFIRAEDGYGGPDTEPLADEAAYDAALRELQAKGKPLKGRIAIGFAAEKGPDGLYRKYGAFNIGGTIIPQHLMRSEGWVVKRSIPESSPAHGTTRDLGAAAAEAELAFVRDNPHREVLLKAFEAGGIEFGRADYAIVDGRVQIYEINTNPAFPRLKITDNRSERRALTRERLLSAFRAIDTPIGESGFVRFEEARPRAHNLHLPRLRLPLSIWRRAVRAARPGTRP
jgi:hypothetical protein